MDIFQQFQETAEPFMPLIIIVIIWEAIWKLIAMWKAARKNHLVWFICLALINTAGILPIIYLLMHRNKYESEDTVV